MATLELNRQRSACFPQTRTRFRRHTAEGGHDVSGPVEQLLVGHHQVNHAVLVHGACGTWAPERSPQAQQDPQPRHGTGQRSKVHHAIESRFERFQLTHLCGHERRW